MSVGIAHASFGLRLEASFVLELVFPVPRTVLRTDLSVRRDSLGCDQASRSSVLVGDELRVDRTLMTILVVCQTIICERADIV